MRIAEMSPPGRTRRWCVTPGTERQRWIDQHIVGGRSQDQGPDYGIDLKPDDLSTSRQSSRRAARNVDGVDSEEPFPRRITLMRCGV
jgi:hypothetical protein